LIVPDINILVLTWKEKLKIQFTFQDLDAEIKLSHGNDLKEYCNPEDYNYEESLETESY
jgi:hypothetical protein